MSKKDGKMVHVQVTPEVREALGVLKRRHAAKRLSDIIENLLLEHEPDAYRYAVQFMGSNESEYEAALEEKRRQVLGEETDED
jgi:mRNA-degrading endonuclease RelE of RelBE toxin-antitoxin system